MSTLIANISRIARPAASETRCFAASTKVPVVRHLFSSGPLTLADVRLPAIWSRYDSQQLDGLLFTQLNYLPPELSLLDRIAGPCRMVGFAASFREIFGPNFRPPRSVYDRQDNYTYRYSPGFPFPKPENPVQRHLSHSFNHEEASAFLGGFTDMAGQLVFLSLTNPDGAFWTPPQLAANFACLEQLIR
ncbi:MAG: hypothetical protein KKF06_00425 [Candidatus Margulisbacteria bacterium]|nr:hypothetical protein [Candidatus Margulisiibacteriota bacterium]MBU1867008.1 hypothetical protein [Candidatus Margulisiibacteriota bacterium]